MDWPIGYILHVNKLVNGQQLLHILTKERGLVHAFCRRKVLQSIAGQSFYSAYFEFSDKINSTSIKQIEPLQCFQLKHHALFSGLYINELLYRTLQPELVVSELFAAYEFLIEKLSHAAELFEIEMLLRPFEWCFLKTMGVQFSCTETFRGSPIEADKYYVFRPDAGFLELKGTTSENVYSGQHILKLAENCELTDVSYRQFVKNIFRISIAAIMQNKPLQSRRLFTLVNQYGDDKK